MAETELTRERANRRFGPSYFTSSSPGCDTTATRNCVARRLAEGTKISEIARILKRYAARGVFKHLPRVHHPGVA